MCLNLKRMSGPIFPNPSKGLEDHLKALYGIDPVYVWERVEVGFKGRFLGGGIKFLVLENANKTKVGFI